MIKELEEIKKEVENIIALDGTWVQKDNISPDDLNT